MTEIFISHSSKDNAWAGRIATWLKEQGYEGIFLDFDPQKGIPAGRDWKQELYHQLRRCRAVIALCSEHFRASEWCLSEVAIASNLGKSLFPIQIGPCTTPALLGDRQVIDLTVDPEEAFELLARGLAEAGLDPKDIFQWDQKRPPYPGLMAFQERDAPVFFGRGEAIQEGLDRLHNLRRYGGKALLLVLGASGCGKSSLVRAGIVPRLRRDPETWLVLDPFRPGLDPFAELAEALTNAFPAKGTPPPDAPATAEDLQRQLEDLRRTSGNREATVVIPIDQFEELLGEGGDSAADQGMGGDLFLAFLREAIKVPFGRLVVLITLRSDFLDTFQCHPKLLGLPFDDLKLGPMEVEGYTQVIEGPAQVAGLSLEPGLSQRMVADTQTGDALPLLAFTLRELWEKYGRDGDITLDEYRTLGGLYGSIRRAADGVFTARSLNPEESQAVRMAFLVMARINEQGQYARIPARWEAMPPEAREVLQRFVKARLLISGKESGTIEVAHEALLRTWTTLKNWLDESHQALEHQNRVRRLCEDLKSAKTLESAQHDAFTSLESIAEYYPQALRLAEETLADVLADGERLPWEKLVAIRLLGKSAGQEAQAALCGLLEREQLREAIDPRHAAIVLDLMSTAACALKQICLQRKATFADGSISLLIPCVTVRADDLAISTSLVKMRLLPSPSVKGQGAWFEELAPGVSLTMVGIPAGSFRMGSPPDEPERMENEGPQHEVTLKGFFLSQTPITQTQWGVVAGWEKVERDLKPDPSKFKGANRPVEGVSWHEAEEFCSRLSQRSGRSYTLPSEAQWEYACRAGTTTPFNWGARSIRSQRDFDGSDATSKMLEKFIKSQAKTNKLCLGVKGALFLLLQACLNPERFGIDGTTDVSSMAANAWGLQDMHKNVLEWCLDYWHKDYKEAPGDGSAWFNPEKVTISQRFCNAMNNTPIIRAEQTRVLRGGGRSAFRQFGYANTFEGIVTCIGFRVCCLPQD
jgi:formylglycine-generating enzyme required for sulfatase activity